MLLPNHSTSLLHPASLLFSSIESQLNLPALSLSWPKSTPGATPLPDPLHGCPIEELIDLLHGPKSRACVGCSSRDIKHSGRCPAWMQGLKKLAMMPYSRNEPFTTINACLNCRTMKDLKPLARLFADRVANLKGDLIDFILQQIEGEGLRVFWDRLAEIERAAVSEVVHASDGRFHRDRFIAKYGQGPERRPHREAAAFIDLLIHDSMMPDDLRARLKEFVPEPRRDQVREAGEPPAVFDRPFERWENTRRVSGVEHLPVLRRESERLALHNILAVLRLADGGRLSVSQTTLRPSLSAMKEVTSVLHGGDFYEEEPRPGRRGETIGPIQGFAWPMILQAARLAKPTGSRLRLTRQGMAALSSPAALALKAAWDSWLSTSIIDEFNRVDAIKGQSGGRRSGLSDPAGRREAIADALAECPVGGWISMEEFFRYLRAADHDFLITSSEWKLYICELQYGSLGYAGQKEWNLLQGRYVLCFLFEYAATLGLIDVAYVAPHDVRRDFRGLWGTDEMSFLSRYDGLLHFRLTPLGEFCLGLSEAYEPAPREVRPALRILPNLEIAVTGPLEPADVLTLDAFTRRVSEGLWRIEAKGLLEAIQAGHRVGELHEFLAARSGEELSSAVLRFLAEVEDRSKALRDAGPARLIECSDPFLAALIARDSSTGRYCLLAGDRNLVVPAGSEAAFRRAVMDMGYVIPPGNQGIDKAKEDDRS